MRNERRRRVGKQGEEKTERRGEERRGRKCKEEEEEEEAVYQSLPHQRTIFYEYYEGEIYHSPPYHRNQTTVFY